ncbi:MAG TPA: glycosyltransferase [Thermoanaerobaculia bacterium]|nr:glycosyltransferase [Thermoanaerobaculia bacterium]
MSAVIIGPVFPYRGAISYCTVKLAEELTKELDVRIVSFSRQYPKRFYPGGDDVDATIAHLAPEGAIYSLDILNPLTWLREGLRLRRSNAGVIVLVWWIWIWALPYLTLLVIGRRGRPLVIQCHNISDKEPAWWKTKLANALFKRASALVVHSKAGAAEAVARLGVSAEAKMLTLFLPVLAIGGEPPARDEAKKALGLEGRDVALFFGHIRPFKGLDIALRAWKLMRRDATLLVVGEVWFSDEEHYRSLARDLGVASRVVFDFRFVPDAEVATVFAAADVVVAPYRHEAQSGVAMNAFHFGRPVIASAVGGIPEIIVPGENGDLVPPEDPEALANSIDAFFASSNRVLMELGARESARNYSWERYGSEVGHLIETLAAGRTRRGGAPAAAKPHSDRLADE